VSEFCEQPKTAGVGTVVVYSRSLDGANTLVVRGVDGDDGLRVAFAGGRLFVSNSSAAIPAANVTGCDADGSSASCPGDARYLLVDAGSGADRVDIEGSVPASLEARIAGGPGADDLNGGDGGDVIEAGDDSDPDRLDGGAGDDALIGARTDLHVPFSSGKSTLIGGPGADVMVGGDPCDGDVFDGGAGDDNANFFRFTPGVTAEIGGPVSRDGGSCAAGRIDGSVESIEGSPGPDVLIGSGAGDTLIGKGDDDEIFGRAGDDTLLGGPGNDRLVGGPGRDSEHE
jgi:Ca2+-binding RTX toxin-like protein